jgi:hypothetical protein
MSILIGLCGRQSAGKSTCADYLAPAPKVNYANYNNPWAYIIANIFGFDYKDLVNKIPVSKNLRLIEDGISLYPNVTNKVNEEFKLADIFVWTYVILKKLNKNILDYLYDNSRFTAPTIEEDCEDLQFVQVSFASPLKKICTAITGIDYRIFLGIEAEYRNLRDDPIAKLNPKFFDQQMTSRELLEQLGTNCFRDVEEDIWIMIASRNISKFLNEGKNIVVSDIRFLNEYNMIKELQGDILVISKCFADLILTEEDRKTHRSKWEFLTFPKDGSRVIMNDGTIQQFHERIDYYLTGFNQSESSS